MVRTLRFLLVLITVSLMSSAAYPAVLSGINFAGGGMFEFGGLTMGYAGVGGDFGIGSHFSLGVRGYVGHGDRLVWGVGPQARIYFIPKSGAHFQPYTAVGGGYGITYAEDYWGYLEDQPGGYAHVGLGTDFGFWGQSMAPFFDVGSLMLFGDDTHVFLYVQSGVRFGIW
ncbi:MAG: hypothetical protein JSW52_00145 [Candidatus Coatesbacteria bacterium]|nr:MAG: hypothetical protein JSW52_00145 [Candidatus Coatesbacteria bacterium]